MGLDPHELVHAYLSSTGHPPTVLVEGVAVALACGSSLFARKPTQTWDQLASAGYSADDSVYYAGTWLVGYLLDVYGPRSFVTLYRTLSSTADASTMDAAFQTIYGVSLSAIWTAALGEGQPRNVCIWQCSRPPLALDGVPVGTSGVCGVEGALPFTLPSESTISLATTRSGFSVKPCGRVPLPDVTTAGLGLYPCRPDRTLSMSARLQGHHRKIGRLGDAQRDLRGCQRRDGARRGERRRAGAVHKTELVLAAPAAADRRRPSPRSFSADVRDGVDLSIVRPASCVGPSQAGPWQAGQVLNITADPSQPFTEIFLDWY